MCIIILFWGVGGSATWRKVWSDFTLEPHLLSHQSPSTLWITAHPAEPVSCVAQSLVDVLRNPPGRPQLVVLLLLFHLENLQVTIADVGAGL